MTTPVESWIDWWRDRWRRRRWKKARRKKPDALKLNLGCGETAFEGYINIDVVPSRTTDFVTDIADLSFLEPETYQEIRLDAVFEHLWRFQQLPFLRLCRRALRDDGVLVLNWLPDFEVLVQAWQNRERGLQSAIFDLHEVYRFTHGDPTPANVPHQAHKDLFTRESIENLLREAGFEASEIENVCYGDEHLPLNLRVRAWKRAVSR
jgi:predicted SAM-dependent methyltransferase